MSEEQSFNLDELFAASSQVALKDIIYGSGGSGKTTNTVSRIVPYLANGYTIVWVVTEGNAWSGLKDGMKRYWDVLTPFIEKNRFFIADLRADIAAYNKSYVGNIAKAAIAPGGVEALGKWLVEAPLCKDFFDPTAKPKLFLGTNSLLSLTEGHKVLLVVDGFSPVDSNTAGYGYKLKQAKRLSSDPWFIAGLQQGAMFALQDAFNSLTIDCVLLAHDRLKSADLTQLSSDKEEQKEATQRRDMLDEQLLNSSGFPAIGTSSTSSKFFGVFGLILHAVDTRLADSRTHARFRFDFHEKSPWYTRPNDDLIRVATAYSKKADAPAPFLPQNWTSSLWLEYLFIKGRLSEENLQKILTLTKQERLVLK